VVFERRKNEDARKAEKGNEKWERMRCYKMHRVHKRVSRREGLRLKKDL